MILYVEEEVNRMLLILSMIESPRICRGVLSSISASQLRRHLFWVDGQEENDLSLKSQRVWNFWAAPLLTSLCMTCSAYWRRKCPYAQQHGFHPFGKSLEWVLPRMRSRRLPGLVICGHSCFLLVVVVWVIWWACLTPFQSARKKSLLFLQPPFLHSCIGNTQSPGFMNHRSVPAMI